MSRPAYWPVATTTPSRMLMNMIEGHAVHPPLNTPPERIREFDAAILHLRLLGWPVMSSPFQESAVGLKFELPDPARFDAVERIEAMADDNTKGGNP